MTEEPEPSSQIRLVGALAGVGSGLTKVAVGHGFDTIKTRLQCSPPGVYKGAIDCLVKTVRNESIFALYKGVTPPAVGWAAIDSVLLGSLHNYRLFLLRHGTTEPVPGSIDERRLTLLSHGIAGLFAGLTSAFLATPMELLKVKLQMQMHNDPNLRQYSGPVDCARKIVRTQGVLGLWTALPASLVYRSNFFWLFGSFEALMRSFAHLKGTRFEMSTGQQNFLAGGLASLIYWTMAIPADNVKNRIMATELPLRPPSLLITVHHVYDEAGVRGFYRGIGTSLLRAFPANACALFVYEGLMRTLGAEKTRQ
ncbi:mitochondrial carrier [Stereum hirsutum FP-91666 SS1]|uniref:mitochondrial carrier n=1 Tax=Stereum hirsutum (strain FP-91666) TaxID=721885 RepID=UPI000440E3F8|nr:mitochondrial carrier [Stereum hirsutum FP-91666 SS1]EIM92606.1 mitochondrial carrier [Stereum hirsutum FP-91666 SS1]